MEISSSSSSPELEGLEGLEKEDEEDEEEIFDSSGKGKQKKSSAGRVFGKSSKKNIQKLNNFLFWF